MSEDFALKRLEMIPVSVSRDYSAQVTPDTFDAIRLLRKEFLTRYPDLEFSLTLPTWEPAITTQMKSSGREVGIQVREPASNPLQELTSFPMIPLMWSLAIPLGFIPFNRYPTPGKGSTLFHYLGPWKRLFHNLVQSGYGNMAWVSVSRACALDAGNWDLEKNEPWNKDVRLRGLEIFVQAQLHRLGYDVGPLNGIIDQVALNSIKALNLGNTPLQQTAINLANLRTPEEELPTNEPLEGVLHMDGIRNVQTWGYVSHTLTPQGAYFTAKGPGKILVDVYHDPINKTSD